MKTVTILAQKGGTGKTTLAIHLSTIASSEEKKVLICDTDPQGSSLVWRERRKKTLPKVLPFKALDLQRDFASIKKSGAELLIIDTPPHSTDDAIIAARLADLILIPSRPAILDLAAISESVNIVHEMKIPGAIILNCCPPPTRFGETAIVQEAREALATYNLPIVPTAISQRAAFSHSLIDGRAVTEYETKGKAAGEIRSLYRWIKKELNIE